MNNEDIKKTNEYKMGFKDGNYKGFLEGQKQILDSIESVLKGESSTRIGGYWTKRFDDLKIKIIEFNKK